MNSRNACCVFALTLALFGAACASHEVSPADVSAQGSNVGPLLPSTPAGAETLRQPAPQDMPGFSSPPAAQQRAATATETGAPALAGKEQDSQGAPFRWDPCTPIRYKTNFALASQVQKDAFYQAVSTVGELTGLTFEDAGSFDGGHAMFGADVAGIEIDNGRSVGSHDAFFGVYTRYDDDVLAGEMALTGTTTIPGVQNWTVTGYSVMQADPWWQDDMELSRRVWLHELGHFVGLGHVGDGDAIMSRFPLDSNPEYGPGDLAGLQRVSSEHGCRVREQPQASLFRKAALWTAGLLVATQRL